MPIAGVSIPIMTLTSKETLNTEKFELVMKINVLGSIYVAKYGTLAMSKNEPIGEHKERGLVIFVSSVAAEEGQRGQVAYSASKGAINGILTPMARDLGRWGIRIMAIAPGIIGTPMTDAMPKNVRERLERDTPMGRFGTPAEFAHLAGAIIENTYLNGVHIRLDGATKMSMM